MPRETRAVDLRKLRDEQKPDFRRSNIPPSASDGSIIWIRHDNVPVMGRLVVLQQHRGLVSNYDCSICICEPYFKALKICPTGGCPPQIVDVPLSDITEAYGGASYENQCSTYQWSEEVHCDYGMWSSDNPATASVDADGKVTGVAPGGTNIRAQSTDTFWTYSGGCCNDQERTIKAQTLARTRFTQYAALTNDTTQSCSGTGFKDRFRSYKGLDQYGWIPFREWWVLNEPFTAGPSNCSQGVIYDGSNNGDLGFPDEICIGCYNSSNCTFQANQTFSVAPNTARGQQRQVPGKNCVGMSATNCYSTLVPPHTGWHVSASASTITVTDN